jgi:hypothetical protein
MCHCGLDPAAEDTKHGFMIFVKASAARAIASAVRKMIFDRDVTEVLLAFFGPPHFHATRRMLRVHDPSGLHDKWERYNVGGDGNTVGATS